MKFLKRIFFALVPVFLAVLLYFEFGGGYILNKNSKEAIAFEIQNSGKLPQNIINYYNTVYKNSLSKNSWNFFLTSDISQKKCPCYETTHRIVPQLDLKSVLPIDYILVNRYIEHNFSQSDCLNFNFSNFDFLENRKGIENVSKSLFNNHLKT